MFSGASFRTYHKSRLSWKNKVLKVKMGWSFTNYYIVKRLPFSNDAPSHYIFIIIVRVSTLAEQEIETIVAFIRVKLSALIDAESGHG